jgi:hypothetical protein
MTKYDTIIAIDPDVDKSGVADLSPLHRILDVASLSFPQLIDYLQTRKKVSATAKTTLLVVVEAGWINKISNYHTAAGRRGQRIAKNVGANSQVGKMIVEMCEYYAIPVTIVKPLKKCWKGKHGKITREELEYFTGLTGQNNQEERDAALLAWVYAGLPVKVNTDTQWKKL